MVAPRHNPSTTSQARRGGEGGEGDRVNPRRGWGILGSVFRRGESGLRAWATDGGSGDWVVLMDRVASVFQSDQVRQVSRAAPGAPTMVLLPPVSNHKSFDIFDIKFNNLF